MSTVYDDLFSEYLSELRAARDQALTWWDGLERAAGSSHDRANAHAAVRLRWPAGPASFPRVIAVYREFFLKCEKLNEQRQQATAAGESVAGWGEDDEDTDAGSTMQPRFLIDNLDAADPELAKFMEAFVFSCIGLDEEGRTA